MSLSYSLTAPLAMFCFSGSGFLKRPFWRLWRQAQKPLDGAGAASTIQRQNQRESRGCSASAGAAVVER